MNGWRRSRASQELVRANNADDDNKKSLGEVCLTARQAVVRRRINVNILRNSGISKHSHHNSYLVNGFGIQYLPEQVF